jgi:two-component system sensor histidine kinase BaeS
VEEVAAGHAVSQRVIFEGRVMFAEGRPSGGADAAASGEGIVLLAASSVGARAILSRLGLALAAGLVAGILAGALLARRLGAPLRQAAAAARRISAGDRTVRLRPQAPAEVAAVSVALNDLATALHASETRQRTFLTSISHELRTPLTTMKGYAEALADGVIGGADEEARRAGATMLAEGERLDRLVEDLLALARLEADDFPLEFVPVDLARIAVDAGQSWAPRCAAVGVQFRVDVPAQPVVVRTDPGRIRQVLDGLLENALRIVPQGAPIVVAVASTVDGPVLEVRDGGPGFTDADLAVAFERGALYERYKGVRKVGSGLGLALAHRLVSRLGGRVEAGHAPEGGARMTVRLPSFT